MRHNHSTVGDAGRDPPGGVSGSCVLLLSKLSILRRLFARLADFAGNICTVMGIEDLAFVLAAVQEKAKGAARKQLAKLIVEQMQPQVIEAIFPEPDEKADTSIEAVFPGLSKKPGKRARSA